MSVSRLLAVFGKDAEQFSDRIATDAKILANEALEAENAATRIAIDRANLYRRPEVKPIVAFQAEATRARSRAGLDRAPLGPTWQSTLPKPADPYAGPQQRVLRFDELTEAEKSKIRELI